MSTQAHSTFKNESWEEQPYLETEDGGKLSRATVRQAITGDIEGEAEIEWLMCYRPDETADFVGLERVVGSIGDRSGSFVLESTGTFDGREARGALAVVRVHEVLGLTPSGAVRLIDRLEAAGYLVRLPGHDGRSTTVRLTRSGRGAARRVSAARASILERAVAELSAGERRSLDALVS